MNRREFLTLASGCVSLAAVRSQPAEPADVSLRIADVTWELAPRRFVKTVAYNGQVPGPVLRARAGRPLSVEVSNETRSEEVVHWHGMHIPPEVDGSVEQGTPPVPPQGRRRYTFTPDPAGTRWYHSHMPAGRDLRRSTYSGQFGLFVVEAGDDAGRYDQEVPLLLHEWEPRFTSEGPLDVVFRAYSVNG